LRVTVFAPDDLVLVQGGPAERRRYLDDVLVALHPRNDALRGEVDRVLRQRTTLLKQAAGRLTPEVASTLEVWDTKLAEAGEALALAREALVARLEPALGKAHDHVASTAAEVGVAYARSWSGGLADALVAARVEDVRRGVTSVGPHRDELVLTLAGLPARTHASQGEQRSVALALRLASHAVVTEATGSAPVLLLDDVFSELDPDRAGALLAHLPSGQALLTTAGPLPAQARPALVVRVVAGAVVPEAGVAGRGGE
jgi:DNA replication and repair protein RecF